MFNKFKKLDKKQKLEFYRVIGWSIGGLGSGWGSASSIGVGGHILGWVIGIVIVFIVFRTLRILRII